MTDASAPPPAPRRRTYKIAGPQTWALARELYLSGLPAPEVAARLDVSVHNLRKKATQEGWSRRQHAERVLDLRLPKIGGDRRSPAAMGVSGEREAAAPDEVEAEALGAEADPLEAARTLLRRAAGAAVAGRLEQAGAAVKLAEGLARAAAALGLADDGQRDGWDDADAEPRLSPEALEELREDVRRRYARFDRPRGEIAPGGSVSGEAAAIPEPVAAETGREPAAAWTPPPAPEPAGTPPEREPPGISRPPRAISVSPWPAWAPRPDAWPDTGWGA